MADYLSNFSTPLLQHQATRRHSVAWMDSLRYRRPDLDRMPGLRRITVCKNPLINDRGAELIAEALKDDLWLKGWMVLQKAPIIIMFIFLDVLHVSESLLYVFRNCHALGNQHRGFCAQCPATHPLFIMCLVC